MAAKQPVWGIDVGQCSLKALKLQAAGDDKVELLGFDLIEHEQILSQAEADATEMVRKAVSDFAGRNDLKNCRVIVSVPGQQTLTRFTKMPPVEKKKIPDMVHYEASQQIPFDMDEVVWDYQVFTEGESPEFEVGIFAIRKELIRSYLVQFTDAGIEPAIVQTGPMASYNAARFEVSPAAGEAIVLLDMGALATDLIVMEGNRIWSRPIPIGGNRFTEALVSAFKIPFKKAEKLKRSAATSKYARQIFQAMRPVFADLVSEVQRSIGYYTSTHRDAHVSRVIGMGNAFNLPGLQKFLQQNLQVEVDKLSGFKRLIEGPIDKQAVFRENLMSLSVCYGLALQGLEMAAVESSLLPIEVRRTLLWQRKRPWFVAAAACLALGAGAIWLGNSQASAQIDNALGGLENVPMPVMPPNADAAMSKIASGGNSSSVVMRAAELAGAAKKLKSEFNSISTTPADAGLLKALAEFPKNNVFVPTILDIVYSAVAAVSQPDLLAIKSAKDYERMVRDNRISPRPQRKEVWLEQFDMQYADNPAAVFARSGEQPKHGRAGWAVRLRLITSHEGANSWAESELKQAIEKAGRKPDRGIFVESVRLASIGKRSISKKPQDFSLSDGGSDAAGPGGRGTGGRRGPRAPSPGDDSSGGRRLPGMSGGFGGDDSGRGSRGGGTGAGSPSFRDLKERINREMREKDLLTGEPITGDWEIILEVVIRQENTPRDLIPEEFKPKPEGDAANAPAKPGTPRP